MLKGWISAQGPAHARGGCDSGAKGAPLRGLPMLVPGAQPANVLGIKQPPMHCSCRAKDGDGHEKSDSFLFITGQRFVES